jgi:hypothetical protein
MQADLASCVQKGCNVTEQAGIYIYHSATSTYSSPRSSLLTHASVLVALTVAQQDICLGIPQPSRSSEIIQCVIAISTVTFPIIALRCLSRYLVAGRIWWDDWLIVVCAVRRPNNESDRVINALLCLDLLGAYDGVPRIKYDSTLLAF